MTELLLAAGNYLVEHGGILGVLVVVFAVVIGLLYTSNRREVAKLSRVIDLLHQGADPERVELRRQITELQEQRVREAISRDAASKLAIERAAHAMEQVSVAIGDQADAFRDFENLVRRKRS